MAEHPLSPLASEASELFALASLRGPVTGDAAVQALTSLGLPLVPAERAYVRKRLKHVSPVTLAHFLALVEELGGSAVGAADTARAALRRWDALPARWDGGAAAVITSPAALRALLTARGDALAERDAGVIDAAVAASGSRVGDTVDAIAVVDAIAAAASAEARGARMASLR